MKKILILGISDVQNDAIELLNKMMIETYAIAKTDVGSGKTTAMHYKQIDFINVDNVISHINENGIDLVYSVGSDIAMPIVAEVSERLGLPHFVSKETALLCNNKIKLRTHLGMDFKWNIPFQIIENQDDHIIIDYPFIMKPADSQGQRGVLLINTLYEFFENFELVKGYSRSGQIIIERYVNGPELSVNAYIQNGLVVYCRASDRETWPEYLGLIHKHLVPSSIVTNELDASILSLVQESCKKVGILNGPAYFQIKIESGKPYLIEMTPRLDGCHMWKVLRNYENVDLLRMTFEHLINNNVIKIDKQKKEKVSTELEFFCLPPNTKFSKKHFEIPSKYKEIRFYYQEGDIVKSVNGKYEKVGYNIK